MLGRSFSYISLAGLCAAVLFFSVSRWQALTQSQRVVELMDQRAEVSSGYQQQLEPVVETLDRVLSNRWASFNELIELSRFYSTLGEAQQDSDLRLSFLCRTEAALFKSLQKEKTNARALVTWASVKQILANYACEKEAISFGPGLTAHNQTQVLGDQALSWRDAIDLAIKSAPLDQQALFNAGLVLLWGQDRTEAFKAFNKVLSLTTDISQLQLDFIYNLIVDEADLIALLPAKMPQILDYLQFSQKRQSIGDLEPQFRLELAKMQKAALDDFLLRYSRQEIAADLFEKRILALWELSRYSPIMPYIDRNLYDWFSKLNQKPLAMFFEKRPMLSEFDTLRAYKESDSRPLKSSLSNWGTQGIVPFDHFFNSIGFYLPKDSTLRRIELYSNQISHEPVHSLVRVYSSQDNYSWEDVTGVCDITSLNLNSRNLVLVEMPGASAPFWKLNFQNAGRYSRFDLPLPAAIRAFGIGGASE